MYRNSRNSSLCVRAGFSKKLRLESLEDRRMLATMLVTDLGDGTLASLAGDGKLSLREAVEAINTAAPVDNVFPTSGMFGAGDNIIFQAGLFGGTPQTLTLTDGQLSLASGVSITGPAGNLLTIDAQQNSRIFDIAAGTDDYTFAQLTLTGGLTSGLQERGGAIRSLTTGRILVRGDSEITGNGTNGAFSNGGAIATLGLVTVIDSSITNNFTTDTSSSGGGVFTFGDVSLTRSTVADNRTEGDFSGGGGISADGMVILENSTVSGNRTLGPASSGGGLLGANGVEIIDSTVSGNSTEGDTSSAAGASSSGLLSAIRSTIVNNHALGASAVGGGLFNGTFGGVGSTVVFGSIVANNTAAGGENDIAPGITTLTVDYSLVGDATGLGIPAGTNLLNQNPLLGGLTNNGGPTETHEPMGNSPVIDMGDPLFAAPPNTDQRGGSFLRVVDGDATGGARIDMGSVELQAPLTPNADFDGDLNIDGRDFLFWQRGAGTLSGASPQDGDSDLDGDVDLVDLGNWLSMYGSSSPASGVSSPANLIDLAIADELMDAGLQESDSVELVDPAPVNETSSRQLVFAALAVGSGQTRAGLEDLASALASQAVSNEDGALFDELLATFE